MKLQTVILVIVIWLTGCDDHNIWTNCEVSYTVNTTDTFVLARGWKLIGFQKNGSSDIAYPPCGRGSGKGEDVTLYFSDTPHTLSRNIYRYPYMAGGSGPVNDFGVSYQTEDGGRITFDHIISTMMGSNDALNDYEDLYFGVISRAERFEITHNLLTLFDDQGDKLLFVALE